MVNWHLNIKSGPFFPAVLIILTVGGRRKREKNFRYDPINPGLVIKPLERKTYYIRHGNWQNDVAQTKCLREGFLSKNNSSFTSKADKT